MRPFAKSIRKIALFLTFMAALSASADVKLRIYLQDGTLQAGNLVSETKDAFVILTKEGREEISKDKIMFVNGKTLKQWEERPDRLFQTEIIPSDIPNPAYVNGQAQLPSSPVIAPVTSPVTKKAVIPPPQKAEPKTTAPAAEPETSKAAKTAAENPPAAPVMKKEPAQPEKQVVKEAAKEPPLASVKPAASLEKPISRRSRRRRAAPATETVKTTPPAPVMPLSAKTVSAPASAPVEAASTIPKPPRFSRVEYGEYHYQKAMEYLNQGWQGQAMQELHMAVLLDRRDEKPAYELGRLYMKEKQFERAEKYFGHPVLRKNEEVKKFIDQMHAETAKNEKNKLVLFYSSGAGLFMTLPLLVLARRFRRVSRPPRVLTAETAEELNAEEAAKPVLEKQPVPEKQTVDQILSDVFAARAKPPEMARPPMAPPPPINIEKPKEPAWEPVQQKPPVEPPPVFKAPPPIEPVRMEEPHPEPVVNNEPVLEPVVNIEPIVEPVVRSVPEPVMAEPLQPAPLPSVDEVLAAASLVDEALEKGNGFALEGQFDKARREYRTALALNPARLEPHLGMGYLCFLQQQWDLAYEHYVKALQINPNSADAHYGIGRVMLETDRVDEAVPRFQMTLKLDPTYLDARDCLTSLGKPV